MVGRASTPFSMEMSSASTVLIYSTVQCSAVQCSAVQCRTGRSGAGGQVRREGRVLHMTGEVKWKDKIVNVAKRNFIIQTGVHGSVVYCRTGQDRIK